MVQTSLPWGVEGGVDQPEMYQDRWRALFRGVLGNGVVNDVDVSTLLVTATGSDYTVQVSAGEAIVEGVHYRSTATENLDVSAVGVAPTVTQTRIDIVALQYDPVAQEVTLVVVPGTPATSGAVDPTLTREADGVWEHPLARITRVGNVAVTQAMITSLRHLSQSATYYGVSAELPEDASDGAIAVRARDILVRIKSGGSMIWHSLIDPEWTNLTMASGYVSAGRTPAYRIHGGHLELRGEVKRSSGAALPDGAWTTIATIPSSWVSGLGASNWPRVPAMTTTWIAAAALRLSNAGQIQFHNNSAPEAAAQSVVYLDGVRLPLE